MVPLPEPANDDDDLVVLMALARCIRPQHLITLDGHPVTSEMLAAIQTIEEYSVIESSEE